MSDQGLLARATVRRVQAALAEAGSDARVIALSDTARTAEDAAKALGVPVGAIVKSLLFLVDGSPVLALVSGANQADERALATAAGGTSVTRPDAAAVRELTGFPIGGVAPFGASTPMRVVVDEDLLTFPVVWAAAGTPRHVFPLAPDDLVRATGGAVCRLARR